MGFAIAKRVVEVVRREQLHDFPKTTVRRREPMLLRAPKRQFQVVADVVGKGCYWHPRSGQIGLQRQLDCVAKQLVDR
jgi:hypothetical protein